MNKSVEKVYHSDEGSSFGRKNLLYDRFPKVSKRQIDNSLSRSDTYTKFKSYSKPRRYSPIYVRNKRELFQCDLISFTQNNLPEENDGYKHIFCTIDVFSKMAWVFPIKDKKCETVLNCFKDILKKCGERPQRVQTDRGTEFICSMFEKYFKDQIIHHYLSYSDRKAAVIERFNLSIQQLLYKIMDYKSTNRWIDCIDQAMKIYLNRKHSTIKMSPLEAEDPKNENEVRRNLFIFFNKNSHLKPQKQKFFVGDTVRVWKYKRSFKRGYDSNFTDEYFTIYKVLKNLPVIRYYLKDYDNEKIVGSYFQEELVAYTPNDYYKINIIDEKGSGKSKKYLINYEGWPDKYNRWVSAQEIENFYQNNDDVSSDTRMKELDLRNDNQDQHISQPLQKENKEIKNKKIFVNYVDDMNVSQIVQNKNKNKMKVTVINDEDIKKIKRIMK